MAVFMFSSFGAQIKAYISRENNVKTSQKPFAKKSTTGPLNFK